VKRALRRILDPEEFLGSHGIRAVSRRHAEQRYVPRIDGMDYDVAYEPQESRGSA